MWLWFIIFFGGAGVWSRILPLVEQEYNVSPNELTNVGNGELGISHLYTSEEKFEGDEPSDLLAQFHRPSSEVSSIHQISRSFLRVTKDILSLTPRAVHHPDQTVDVSRNLRILQGMEPADVDSLLREQGISAPKQRWFTCDPSASAYRTQDGSCNNHQHPCWGRAEEPYQRWLDPDYANGIDEPRRRPDGHHLPNPRQVYQWVSSEFEQSVATEFPFISNLLVLWGQFIAHDMVLTPVVTVKTWDGQKFKDKKLQCCNSSTPHPDCNPLIMHQEDIYYPRGHCMEFVRSSAYAIGASSCSPITLGRRREQINQLTAFLDASAIYGTSEEEMRKLREHGGRGAKLLMSELFGRSYPPRINGSCKSSLNSCDKRCLMIGEKRANENPFLSALHTLFARHHNRLVDLLQHLSWGEETLFQVVRKMVGAQIQHITYHEYLPLILGTSLANTMELTVPTARYVYDSNLNPTLYNVFAAAAFRFGHSMVGNILKRKDTRQTGNRPLSQDFFSMDDYCDTSSDCVVNLLAGQAEQHAQKVDCLFTKQLTNHLFAKLPAGPGLDLFSINIQRGRDHGLPSYNKWREACGLKKATDYADLRIEVPGYVVDRLEVIYGAGRVDDVDLFVAGVSEFPVNDGILGPTFTCIVANQFRNLKYGDRFWYENTNHSGAFNPAQIAAIQTTTLSSLLCQNSDIAEIQPLAFVAEGPHNPKQPCALILQQTLLDLSLWG